MSPIIAPSILAADFANLEKEIEMLNESEADLIHVDIMDGVFVPNISFGFPVMEAIKKYSKKPMDVHLMIIKPERYIKRFREAGADELIVHLEACVHLHSTIQEIRKEGMGVGVAINPHTPVSLLKDVLKDINQVLIMSVNPGFGGQNFIEHTYKKIEETRRLIMETESNAIIGIDGGVDLSNGLKLVDSGADLLVAGSSVFKSSNPRNTISALKELW